LGIAFFITLLVFVFATTFTAAARGQDKEAESRAALALAKAKREREAVKLHTMDCHTDLAKATKEAEATGKPLVVWAGVKCADYPVLRKALSGAVHCHIDASRHRHGEAIVIQAGDGTEFFVRPEKITDETGAKIKAKWAVPWVPPVRSDVVVSEELSWFASPPVYYQTVYTSASYQQEVQSGGG